MSRSTDSYAATAALCGLHVPSALPRLAQRIFDPELKIAVLALDVLATYLDDAGFSKVKEQVRVLIVRGDQFQKQRAILAASELKDVGALEALIDVLNTRPLDELRALLRERRSS